MSDMTIEVQPREATGKNANRKLRAAGRVPAVVYGAGKDAVAIQLERRDLLDLLRGTQNRNPIFLLKLGETGQSRHAMIRDMDVDPVNRQVRHVDFLRILMTEKLHVAVHIELLGVPDGVKNEGGVLDFITRQVEVECLPDKIPSHLEIDVSDLNLGQHIEVSALELPEGVELYEGHDKVIASVKMSKAALADEEELEEDEELLEAESDEPQVIGKGKGEDEDGADA